MPRIPREVIEHKLGIDPSFKLNLGIWVSLKFRVELFGFLKVRAYINRTQIDIGQSDTQKFGFG
jgi:carboxylesterase type B